MCGIAGLIDPAENRETRAAVVARMCAAMEHRGPDDAGIETVGPATLGMRRLAIFDPANGHQPMVSPDGRHTLVFNGAIYNFRALRAELAGGWSFRTECDTEVLLAALVRWGEGAIGRLRGMFAFALWDAREQTLLLARDPLGIKPLYYRREGARLTFASEVNALVAGGAFAPQLDPVAVVDYLSWLAVPAPRTIYREVLSLRPGERAVWRAGRLDVRATWDFGAIPLGTPCATREEFVRELRAKLDDTVRAHVVADVPVGAFLSGGLDSAAVVGLMTRASGARLKTFSIDFAEPGYSEAGAAEATARHFGTEHRTSVLTGAEVAGDIERLLGALDQPTGDGINTYYASRAARAGGVTAALSGLGGDELFGGYPAFQNVPRLARWLPVWRALPGPARGAMVRRLQKGDTRRRKLADVLAHAHDPHELAALQRQVFSAAGRRDLLSPEARHAAGPSSPFHPELGRLARELDDAGLFELVSAWELRTYMADVLLRDSDVMSMRHSLELRVPFVDRPLLEWLWRQPAEFKYDARQPKRALRDAVADLLPRELAAGPKRGFTLPFALWMKRELRPFLAETFSDASVARSGLFAREAVQRRWQEFAAGHDPRDWSRVWSLAVLIAFANRRTSAAPARPVPVIVASSATTTSRTLFVVPEIFASEGGIPRILQLYLKALCEHDTPGAAVRLVALNDATLPLDALRRHANGSLETWTACARGKPRFLRAVLRLSRGCDRLVCGHLFQLPAAWLARRLNPRLRYYLVAHGIEVGRTPTHAQRIALQGAEKIFCVSAHTRRELLKHCPLPESKTVVLPNALDPAFPIAAGRPLPECPPVILAVTRLAATEQYKGVEHLIAAMPAILAKVPAARLRVVGRGDDRPRLHALCGQLGVSAAVEFLGYVDDGRLAEELSACRLFALPSEREGFGLVYLEAMAHGRPCLAARAGGAPEVISPESGVLVEFGDVPGIAAACVDALGRAWDESAILDRARQFTYPIFKDRLAGLLAA